MPGSAEAPLASVDLLWNHCADRFPAHKLRLTGTGWATQESAPSFAPNNVPSVATSKKVYALVDWQPRGAGPNAPKFWFMAYDRRPDDFTFAEDYEHHFGLFTIDRQAKMEHFLPRLVAHCNGKQVLVDADEEERKHFGFEQDGCRIVFGVDYAETYNIGPVPSDSALGCCQICREFNHCQAFAFSSYQGGTCWLKSQKGASIVNIDTIGGCLL